MAARTERALSFATASDITTIHLPPAQRAPAQTHGSYRGRAGTDIAVAAHHNLSRLPGGMLYQVWIMQQGSWISMGTALPDSLGDALVVGEGPQFTALPQRIEVTIEPARGSAAPTGQVVISWMNEQRSSQ